MTLSSSPLIENCWMENNNIDNSSPYPYINIGLQGVNSPTIRGCTILGSGHHMSGGISIWNAGSGVIEGSQIEGCGYGILCYQTAASPTIRNNTLVANNIHPDTMNWGFGVACNGNHGAGGGGRDLAPGRRSSARARGLLTVVDGECGRGGGRRGACRSRSRPVLGAGAPQSRRSTGFDRVHTRTPGCGGGGRAGCDRARRV